MSALSITAANVAASAGATTSTGTAGETITAGQVVYVKAADGKYWAAGLDTAAKNTLAGVALCGAAAGQPLTVQTAGSLTIGATVAAGSFYAAGATGTIVPVADLTTGNYTALVGIGTSTTVIQLALTNTLTAHA